MANEVRLIDANALVSKRFRMHSEFLGTVLVVKAESIENAPTIDPESLRPKGRWVDQVWNDMWQSMSATCSHCLERGEVRVRTNEYGMKVINSPSCPNCGAKMEG